VHQIYSQMQIGQAKHQMQTMNQSLCALYIRRMITLEEAIGRSSDPDELQTMISNASQSAAGQARTPTGGAAGR